MQGKTKIGAAGVVAAVAVAVSAGVASANGAVTPQPRDDAYATGSAGTLAVDARHGVLGNDKGSGLQIVGHSDPADGALTFNNDGSFNYVPKAGFTGKDSFTYTVTTGAHLYKTDLPSLGDFGGVNLTGGGYGSSLSAAPGKSGIYYGVTDRGPNATLPDGSLFEPLPTFDPQIGEFKLVDGKAQLLRTIPLRDASGHPYSGLINTANVTGETMETADGVTLANDPDGYDSEGLAVMKDGSFWVSDEYGPFVTHFDRNGRQLQRLSPFNGGLPAELANRIPNKGMEGLTVTPDGRTLVGMMQSSLQQADLNGSSAKNLTPLRIVTYDLRTHAEHEYLYLADNPKTTGTAVSEISALSATQFLVDERNGSYVGTGAYKKLYKIDISKATDVGPSAKVAGAGYDAAKGGLLVGGKTIEANLKGDDTATSQSVLQAAGIAPVTKSLYLDINALLLSLDPQARFFSHDKIEGVAVVNGGKQIVISNDSDFGIDGVTGDAPPFGLHAKLSPTTGKQDDGEFLSIDMTRPITTLTATVTINVG